MRKEAIFFGMLVCVLFFMPLGLGQSCADDQVILRLSSSENAHGEIASNNNYPVDICYDAIFGASGTGNRVCDATGSNVIVKLSDTTNAHAEDPQGTNYPISVCYEGLTCRIASTGTCFANESAVVELSALTNAHLALPNSGFYTYTVCCSVNNVTPPPPPPVQRVFWTDSNGNELGVGARVDVGDIVYLVAEGITPGSNIDFTIYDEDILSNDQLLTASATDSDNDEIVSYDWNILPQHYDLGDNFGEGGNLEVFFRAEGSGFSHESVRLDLYPGAPPEPPQNDTGGNETVEGCAIYINRTACESYSNNVAYDDPAVQGLDCGGAVICFCEWNNQTDKCVSGNRLAPIVDPGTGEICNAACENTEFSFGECDGVQRELTILREAVELSGTCTQEQLDQADLDCPDQIDVVRDCRIATLQLPFFGFAQVFLALGLIIIGYFLFRRDKEHGQR